MPEAKRDAAHWFVLGNMLFAQDFALSYSLHKKAFELAPGEALVQLEWAIERQRKDETAEAEQLYAPLAAGALKDNAQLHALRSECLLRLGRTADAVASWNLALKSGKHGPIESAFFWVHGRPEPWSRRAPLLAKAKAGDADAATELWLLDLHWDSDWWNDGPNADHLERDRPVVQKAVGGDSPDWNALDLLARYTPADRPLPRRPSDDGGAAKFLADAKAAGFLGDKPRLPKSSRVASNLMKIAVDRKAATAADLHRWFAAELEQRAKSGDAVALEAVCATAEEAAPDQIGALEKLGWEKFGDVACVCGMLGRQDLVKLKRDDPLLTAALAKHGDDERLASLALAFAQRDRTGVVEAASRLALAQLKRLVSIHSVLPTFHLIEVELQKSGK